MFESWSAWTWVALAWAELVVAYGAYLLYLRWREKSLDKEDAPSND